MRDHITGEIAAAAAKVTPPLAVSTAVASGLTLQDGVLLATLAYTLVQTSLVIVRGWGDWLGVRGLVNRRAAERALCESYR